MRNSINWLFFKNNKGFADGADNKTPPPEDTPKTFTQEQVDSIVQERALRETRSKFADYDALKEKVANFEKTKTEKEQQDLEHSKDYDKAKENFELQIKDLQSKLGDKDGTINGMKINSALTTEISKQGAYAEEALALMKSNALLSDEGIVVIKSKDTNGIETSLSVEEGVKQFLAQRPHLVKANQREGSGSAGGTPPPTGGRGDDLISLTNQLNDAKMKGDQKLIGELKAKVRAKLPAPVM